MNMEYIKALAFINVILGCVVQGICLCRLIVSDKKVIGRVRLKFILLGPISLAFSVSPIWGPYIDITGSFVLLCIIIGLGAESYQWRKGPPQSVKKDTMPAELREEV